MMTDFRALCAELLDEVVARPLILDRELIARARAALGEADEPAAPAPPADGEVAELVAWLKENAEDERQMSGGDNPASLKLDRTAELLKREGWALRRLHRLHQENARFREPERTILCDILANGTLLPDPDGKRYGVQPVDGEVAELVTWLQEIGETIKPRHLAEHQRYKRAAALLRRSLLR